MGSTTYDTCIDAGVGGMVVQWVERWTFDQ